MSQKTEEVTKETNIHSGYVEWELAKERGIDFTQLFGKYHFIFTSKKGIISLIELKNNFYEGEVFWEILCFKGKLIEDTERFDTQQEAKKRIMELLE